MLACKVPCWALCPLGLSVQQKLWMPTKSRKAGHLYVYLPKKWKKNQL